MERERSQAEREVERQRMQTAAEAERQRLEAIAATERERLKPLLLQSTRGPSLPQQLNNSYYRRYLFSR